jgi:twitching motility protein PilT
LKVGAPPVIRAHGLLEYIGGYEVLRPVDTEDMLEDIIPEKLVEEFEEDGEADFSYDVQGVGRFRVNAFRQRGSVSIVMRFIPFGVPKFENLNLPEVIGRLAREKRGIILVAGTTGSGKSTTLASMLNLVNRTASKHIVAIRPDRVPPSRREEHHKPTRGWAGYGVVCAGPQARPRAGPGHHLDRRDPGLRERPDSSLGGGDRPPGPERDAHRGRHGDHKPHDRPLPAARTGAGSDHDLADTLKGILGQRLVRNRDGEGRAAACEVMVTTGRIKDFILDPEQTGRIQTAIAEGEYYGMQTFDQALLKLVEEDRINYQDALKVARRPRDFRLMVQSLGLGAVH